MLREFFSVGLIILTSFYLRVISVIWQIQNERSMPKEERDIQDDLTQTSKRQKAAVTLIVLGSGGHTTEMMTLQSKLNPDWYKPIVHVIARTDHTSENRILSQKKDEENMKKNSTTDVSLAPDITYRIPRSREVGQSYFSSIFSTLYAFFYAVIIVWKVQPDVVLCNGPGTCLPIVVISFIFGKWKRIFIPFLQSSDYEETKLIFVESFCRVQHLSLTGKLLYPFVDRFVVHWDELHAQYPLSSLVETFVRRS